MPHRQKSAGRRALHSIATKLNQPIVESTSVPKELAQRKRSIGAKPGDKENLMHRDAVAQQCRGALTDGQAMDRLVSGHVRGAVSPSSDRWTTMCVAFGSGHRGQLGNEVLSKKMSANTVLRTNFTTPQAVSLAAPSTPTAIACGGDLTLVVTIMGELLAFGAGSFGDRTTHSSVPKLIAKVLLSLPPLPRVTLSKCAAASSSAAVLTPRSRPPLAP